MSKNVIPVFFNTDDKYVVPTYIALFSLLYNYRGSADILACILTAGGLSQENVLLLNTLTDRFKTVEIRIIDASHRYDNVEIKQKYISSASMYRLMIPRLADELFGGQMDTCIYLDSDLVVEGDLSELFQIDIDGYYIGGVIDKISIVNDSAYRDMLGIPSLDRYLNSGVLLMNLKEINHCPGMRDRLEEAGNREGFVYRDQDAINAVLYDGIKTLPLRYNVMINIAFRRDPAFCNRFGREQVAEARKAPFIVHYISSKKPWLYRTTVLGGRWWKYVRLLDKKTFHEYIKPFLKAHRVPFSAGAKEAVKSILKYSGAFYWLKDQKTRLSTFHF